MRIILLLMLILSSNQVFAQKNLDEKIGEGIELYQNGKEKKALKVWKKIEEKADKPSSTYGTTLGNILYYYIQNDDEESILKYYEKIMNSDLNDRDENFEIGKPYKNYRYHATMRLASYYGKKGEFEKGLSYVEKADNEITFETTSLTSFIYQKVDLAFWKYRFLNDLGQNKNAVSKLIERALEYDYKSMYPSWATVSTSNDENELAETICSEFDDLEKLKLDIDNGIENLSFEKERGIINLKILEIEYEINLYSDIETDEDCKAYLRNSFFYQYLTEKTK
ncbi:hypothetical protein [Cyclobacterium amurskyense]|nr:hypothetical protein [Cyclobacterium amurskyense]